MLRSTTERFLNDLVPVETIRRLREDPLGYEDKYWQRGAELGWAALLVSEENGGGSVSGHPLTDLTLVAHEFGVHAAPGPLGVANAVCAALDASGGHEDELGAVMAGEAVATWAYGEAPPGDRLGELACTVELTGDTVVVNGVKRPVEAGAAAAFVLVTGLSGDGVSQVLVPVETPGVTVTPMKTVDLTRRFAAVSFDNVTLPASALVGEFGGAAAAVERQLQIATVIANAESVGAMQRAFDMTVAWAFDRYSFGRPLASYQELKHRFADMKSWLEAAHAISDDAALAVDAGSADAAELVSAAKAFIGKFGTELLQDCVQIHGGIGLTFEHDLHLFLRRVVVNRSLWGDPADHLRQLGAALIARREGWTK